MTKAAKQILERVYNKGFNDRCQQEKYDLLLILSEVEVRIHKINKLLGDEGDEENDEVSLAGRI